MKDGHAIVVVVQARMGSTRLPGKVLKPIGGRPMLAYLIERLRRVSRADGLVVATSTNPADDAIAGYCASAGIACVRGPEHDVLARFVQAARAHDAGTVVRITADCPLIDPELVDSAIQAFEGDGGRCDFVSNMLEPGWPLGMAVEVMSASALEEAAQEAVQEDEREHVTPFIWRQPARYRLRSLRTQPDRSRVRLTVDTPEDLELVTRILVALHPRKPEFTLADVLELLQANPSWESLNRDVTQKTVTTAGTRR